MRLLKSLITLVTTLGASSEWAAMPDVVWHLEREIMVIPHTFETFSSESIRETYRFKAGDLFISSSAQSEYSYGKVVEVEAGCFVVGHKTLIYGEISASRYQLLMFHAAQLTFGLQNSFAPIARSRAADDGQRRPCPPAATNRPRDGAVA